MTVRRICQRDVDVANVAESAQVAAGRMASRNVGSLLVLDGGRRPVGILTDRDLAVRVVAAGLSPLDTLVGDVMTPDPRTVGEATPIEEALGVMRAHGVRRLPVVDRSRRLLGIVSVDDILAWMAGELRQLTGVIAKTSPKALVAEKRVRRTKRPVRGGRR